MTQWVFGFGGWIGVLGGTFMFVNVPHNYTILLLLLSPWLGAISLYLLMFATFSWMNVCAQITAAMLKHEIIVALLTSCIGVIIVAIARQIIDMERGHRTPAQAAADESAATNTALPPSPVSEPEAAPSEDSDAETKSLEEHNSSGEDGDGEDDEEGDEEDGEGEEDSSNDGDDEGGSEHSEESDKTDSESSLNKARTDSSYENIQTPQLTALATGNVSPIPTIPDV